MSKTIDFFPPSTPLLLLLLVVAFALSAVIGLEQQRRLRSTGLRTHTLVGVGSALFTVVSAYGFFPILGAEVVLDPSRVAAQIVSGIGFLGAGVIFVRQNVVNGLTTAASIWVTAAVGMACGAGMPVVAAFVTFLYIVTIVTLTPLGRYIRARSRSNNEECVLRYKDGKGVLREILTTAAALQFNAVLSSTHVIERDGKRDQVEASFKFTGRPPLADLVEALSEIRGVTSVNVTNSDDS